MSLWNNAIAKMLTRMEVTRAGIGNAYPHWCNTDTGTWTTTPNGDWTGGYWIGMHWLAARITGEQRYRSQAVQWQQALARRTTEDSVFKSFPFYYGAALGAILCDDPGSRALALACARTMPAMFQPTLGLIPLGSEAEEGAHIGNTETSIDSLQTAPFLFWAAGASGDEKLRETAHAHAQTIIGLHRRDNDTFIQSSSLDPRTGKLVRHYTHKGYSDTSTWGRAQGWGMLFSTMSWLAAPHEPGWLDAARRGADWWIAHAPADRISFWDFDDPAIPDTERDTAASTIACLALLKLAAAVPDAGERARYRSAAEATAQALIGYLTPLSPQDPRTPGMLTQCCFNKRTDARPQDATSNRCEFILSDYYLLASLAVLDGKLEAAAL